MKWLGRIKPVIRLKPRFKPVVLFSFRRGKPDITISPMRIEPVVQAKPRVGPFWGKWFHKK